MILHTTSDSFAILKHKRRKGNGKKSNTDHFQHEFTEKLRKYDLLFLGQSAWPYAACVVIYVFVNGRQFARIC